MRYSQWKTTKSLINYLFPGEILGTFRNTQTKRLYDSQFFNRYFTLKVSPKDVAENEFRQFMEQVGERTQLLQSILTFGRFDNLLIRLSDNEIGKKYRYDFDLVEVLYNFCNIYAEQIVKQATRVADVMMHLLVVREKQRERYFNQFIDLLRTNTKSIEPFKTYFLHYMLQSKEDSNGFLPGVYHSFKEFYLQRCDRIKTYYLEYLRSFHQYFLDPRISKPKSFYTELFVYDYATFYPSEYKIYTDKLLSSEENLLFFISVILSISSDGEPFRIRGREMNLFLPNDLKSKFYHQLKSMDVSRLTEDEKKWRNFVLEYFDTEGASFIIK